MLGIRAFTKAPNVVDYPYSTLTGATIINAKTWEQIPADLRPKIKGHLQGAQAERAQGKPASWTVRRSTSCPAKADGSPLSPPDPSKAVLKRVRSGSPAAAGEHGR